MLSQENQPASADTSATRLAIAECRQRWMDAKYLGTPLTTLARRFDSSGHTTEEISQVGTLVLKPRSATEGTIVSATTLAAPDKAKSAFAKGQQREQKGKWAAVCDYFRKAVQVYPKYALAWLELGRAEVKQNDFQQAQRSFQQAATKDSRRSG